MEATDGKIYGTTSSGGLNNIGYIFQYDFIEDNFQNVGDFVGTDFGHSGKALFQPPMGNYTE